MDSAKYVYAPDQKSPGSRLTVPRRVPVKLVKVTRVLGRTGMQIAREWKTSSKRSDCV